MPKSKPHPVSEVDKAFFETGRDYEPITVNHKYTEKEKRVLASYESVDYLPPDSKIYRRWLKDQRVGGRKIDWDRWLVMGLIGFLVGLVGFFLHQLIALISEKKWEYAKEKLEAGDIVSAYGYLMGYSMIFLIFASVLVVYFRPSAASSGMPELIGYLNGTLVRHIFQLKTLLVKFVSCCFSVGSGMPVGPEGPMIHMGALVGAGVSNFGSKTLGLSGCVMPFFLKFHNSKDKRDFISAGAAAGVASAFGAPVGGLLFAMEEVSSHWSLKLSWQVFFCCMVAAFTTDLLDSSFSAFSWDGDFGRFRTERYILFNVGAGKEINMNLLALIPTAMIGVIGGLFGACFSFCNLKIVRTRRSVLGKFNSPVKNVLSVLEPMLIMAITTTLATFLPQAFPCTEYECLEKDSKYELKCYIKANESRILWVEEHVEEYSCLSGTESGEESGKKEGNLAAYTAYNEAATLWFNGGDEVIHRLFSRGTHKQFGYASLASTLVAYFCLACWTAGSYISSGLVVPMLLIGGLVGRIFGRIMVDIFGIHHDSYWEWIDPGAMAMVGAVSFFGGVTRLTISLTVIMVEMTNDIQFLLLIMTAVMFSKWAGDLMTHPLYHAMLELKCIPFLEADPLVVGKNAKGRNVNINLDLCTASQVMTTPVHCFRLIEVASRVANTLLDTSHGAFPVVSSDDGRMLGLVGRPELMLSLRVMVAKGLNRTTYTPTISFSDVMEFIEKRRTKHNSKAIREMLAEAIQFDDATYLDLSPLKSKSAVSVDGHFSLMRTYRIFRTLGLRHLVVTGAPTDRTTIRQQVQGIITRKDLMGCEMEKRILEGGMTQEEAEKWKSSDEHTVWSPQEETQYSHEGTDYTYNDTTSWKHKSP